MMPQYHSQHHDSLWQLTRAWDDERRAFAIRHARRCGATWRQIADAIGMTSETQPYRWLQRHDARRAKS